MRLAHFGNSHKSVLASPWVRKCDVSVGNISFAVVGGSSKQDLLARCGGLSMYDWPELGL